VRLFGTRLSRSPVVFWLAVGVLALATASVVARLVNRADALADRYGPLRPAVVAARAVERGTELEAADVAVSQVPARFLPEGAVATVEEVRGRTVVVPLVAGETVMRAHLAPEGLAGVAALLPPGTRAVAVPVGAASAPARRGDLVDLIATFDPHAVGDGDPTLVVAADALVVDVGAESATVAVRPDEARAVAFAVTHGSVTVVVTPGVAPASAAVPAPVPAAPPVQRTPEASRPSTTAPTSNR
jgi:Flp pilus assembly protein CpaB